MNLAFYFISNGSCILLKSFIILLVLSTSFTNVCFVLSAATTKFSIIYSLKYFRYSLRHFYWTPYERKVFCMIGLSVSTIQKTDARNSLGHMTTTTVISCIVPMFNLGKRAVPNQTSPINCFRLDNFVK